MNTQNYQHTNGQYVNQQQLRLFTPNIASFGNLPSYSSNRSSQKNLILDQQRSDSFKSSPPLNHYQNGSTDTSGAGLFIPNLDKSNNFRFQKNHSSSDQLQDKQGQIDQSIIMSQKSTNLSMISGGQQLNISGLTLGSSTSPKKFQENRLLSFISIKTYGLLKQLYSELTLSSLDKSTSLMNIQNGFDSVRFQKGLRNSMEGLFKVLVWRLDGTITSEEFTQIYGEWLKKRDLFGGQQINSKSVYMNNEFAYFIELIQNQMKDIQNIENQIPLMIKILREEFNNTLVRPFQLAAEREVKLTQNWIKETEILFEIIDDFGRGSIDGERIQFFLMALLLNEIKPENKNEVAVLIQRQTQTMLEHMNQSQGSVNLKNFKQYLITQRLRREQEIITLKGNLVMILKCWGRIKSRHQQYPMISNPQSRFPLIIAQAFLNSIENPQFTQWCLKQSYPNLFNINDTQIYEPTFLQHWKMLKFISNELFEISNQTMGIEGTFVNKLLIDQFADKLVSKFLLNVQGEIVVLNISNLKNIFKNCLCEFERLNTLIINDIINQIIQQRTDIEAQNSPPQKPNLSPITSQKRLNSHSSSLSLLNAQINNQNQETTPSDPSQQPYQTYMTFSPKESINKLFGGNKQQNTSTYTPIDSLQSTDGYQNPLIQSLSSHSKSPRIVQTPQQQQQVPHQVISLAQIANKVVVQNNATHHSNSISYSKSNNNDFSTQQQQYARQSSLSNNSKQKQNPLPQFSINLTQLQQNTQFPQQLQTQRAASKSPQATSQQRQSQHQQYSNRSNSIRLSQQRQQQNPINNISMSKPPKFNNNALNQNNHSNGKVSLRQQIEQQQNALKSLQNQQNNLLNKNGMKHYSSHQQSEQQFSQVIISQTPLDNIPHFQSQKDKNSQSITPRTSTKSARQSMQSSMKNQQRPPSQNKRYEQSKSQQQFTIPRSKTPTLPYPQQQQQQQPSVHYSNNMLQSLSGAPSNLPLGGPVSISSRKSVERSSVRADSNYERSPLRSRRVESYEDVFNRLLTLSQTNIQKKQ